MREVRTSPSIPKLDWRPRRGPCTMHMWLRMGWMNLSWKQASLCRITHRLYDMGTVNHMDTCPNCKEDALYTFEGCETIYCLSCAWYISTTRWMEWTTLRRGFALWVIGEFAEYTSARNVTKHTWRCHQIAHAPGVIAHGRSKMATVYLLW